MCCSVTLLARGRARASSAPSQLRAYRFAVPCVPLAAQLPDRRPYAPLPFRHAVCREESKRRAFVPLRISATHWQARFRGQEYCNALRFASGIASYGACSPPRLFVGLPVCRIGSHFSPAAPCACQRVCHAACRRRASSAPSPCHNQLSAMPPLSCNLQGEGKQHASVMKSAR